MFELLDAVETYETVGPERARQCVTLIGKTIEGVVVQKVVRDLEHYVYAALDRILSAETCSQIAYQLNERLLKKKTPCQRMDCPCRVKPPLQQNINGETSIIPKKRKEFYICVQACREDRDTDARAVERVDIIQSRGFFGFEKETRPFLRVQLTRSYYANWVLRYALQEILQPLHMERSGILKSHQLGLFECADRCVESYLNQAKGGGYTWIDETTGGLAKNPPPETVHAPLKVLIIDIETPTARKGFPTPEKGDQVASMVFECHPEGVYYAMMIRGKSTIQVKKPEGLRSKVAVFETEKEMLQLFHRMFMRYDPDILAGYNSTNFDWPYIFTRMRLLGMPEWNQWSRITTEAARWLTSVRYSKQQGKRIVTTFYIPGRQVLDVMCQVVKDITIKSPSKKLGEVGEWLGLGKKDDMPIKELLPSLNGTMERRGFMLKYNERDVILTGKIMKQKLQIPSLQSNSALFRILGREELVRGVSYKLSRMIYWKTYPDYLRPYLPYVKFEEEAKEKKQTLEQFGFCLDELEKEAKGGNESTKKNKKKTKKQKKEEESDDDAASETEEEEEEEEDDEEEEAKQTGSKDIPEIFKGHPLEMKIRLIDKKIKGGHVAKPKVGFHHYSGICDCPIETKRPPVAKPSAPPSICEVHPKKLIGVLDFASLYPSLINTHNICPSTWIRSHEEARQMGLEFHRDYEECPNGALFVKAHIRKGFFPELVVFLVEKRKEVKKQIAAETDPVKILALKSVESAIKVAANAMYGQLCMRVSTVSHMVAGDAVTSLGREYIQKVMAYIESAPQLKGFDPEIIYGDTDSCMIVFSCPEGVEQGRERFIQMRDAVNITSKLLHGSMSVSCDSLNEWMILMKKKNYIFSQIKPEPGAPIVPVPVSKGVEFIKGDSMPYVRRVGNALLKGMVKENWSVSRVIQFVRFGFQDLLLANTPQPVSEDLPREVMESDEEEEGWMMVDLEEDEGWVKIDWDEPWVRISLEKLPREEFLMTMKLSKSVSQYSKTSAGSHVVAARQLQKAGHLISPGDAIEFFYCKLEHETNKVGSLVLAADLYKDQDFHIEHYSKKYVKAFTRLMSTIIGEEETTQLFLLSGYDHVQPFVDTVMSRLVCQKVDDKHVHRITRAQRPLVKKGTTAATKTEKRVYQKKEAFDVRKWCTKKQKVVEEEEEK